MCRKCNSGTKIVLTSPHCISHKTAKYFQIHGLFSWHSDCFAILSCGDGCTVCSIGKLATDDGIRTGRRHCRPREVRSQPMLTRVLSFVETKRCDANNGGGGSPPKRVLLSWSPPIASCAPPELMRIIETSCDVLRRVGTSQTSTRRRSGQTQRDATGAEVVRTAAVARETQESGYYRVSALRMPSELTPVYRPPVRSRHDGPRWEKRHSVATATVPESAPARRKATVLFI